MLNILPVIIFYLIISAPIYGQQNSLSVVRACDFDGSGVIDIGDFLLFVDSFGTNEEKYDLDGDGAVAVSDFLIFVDYFGKVVPPATEPVLAVGDTLDLSNTGIKMLTKEQFKQYPGVKVLILDDNEISVIEAGAFDGMNSVERIFARRNQISEIPDSLLYGLGALRAVDFTENPGVPFPLALRLQRTDAPDATTPMPATLTVSWPIALPIDWKHLVFVRNLHQGNRIDVAIPARMHEKAFTFGDWDTEVAGWRYSDESAANSNPPYRMYLEIRNHQQYKVTYGVNSHEGTGLYGFRLVTPDTLCLYAACSGEDFAAPSRDFAGGGGGGAPTQPDPSSPTTSTTTSTTTKSRPITSTVTVCTESNNFGGDFAYYRRCKCSVHSKIEPCPIIASNGGCGYQSKRLFHQWLNRHAHCRCWHLWNRYTVNSNK